MLRRFTDWLATTSLRRPLTPFLIAGVGAAFAAHGVMKVRFSSDVYELLPDRPAANAWKEMRAAFPRDEETVFALLEWPEGEVPEETVRAVAEQLANRSVGWDPPGDGYAPVRRPLDDPGWVWGPPPESANGDGVAGFDPAKFLDALHGCDLAVEACLLPKEVAIPAIRRLGNPAELEAYLKREKARIAARGPLPGGVAGGFDPFGLDAPLMERIMSRLRELPPMPERVQWNHERHEVLVRTNSAQGRPRHNMLNSTVLFPFGTPHPLPLDPGHWNVQLGYDAPLTGTENLRLSLAGGPIVAWETEHAMRRDLIWTTITSAIAVALILCIWLGGWRSLVYTVVPLAFGLWGTLGAAGALGITITPLTAAVGAMLIGLGIDFTIHLVHRYREECALASGGPGSSECAAEATRGEAEHPRDRAIRSALRETNPSLLAAAVTTAAAMGALALADFRGLADLGLLSALGILICLVATWFTLPPLLRWLEPAAGRGARVPAFAVPSFGPAPSQTSPLQPPSNPKSKIQNPKWPLALSALATFVAFVLMFVPWKDRLAISPDMTALRAADSETLDMERRIVRDFEPPVGPWPIFVSASDPRSLEMRLASVETAFGADATVPMLIFSLSSLFSVQPHEDQQAILSELASLTSRREPVGTGDPFSILLGNVGLSLSAGDEAVDRLNAATALARQSSPARGMARPRNANLPPLPGLWNLLDTRWSECPSAMLGLTDAYDVFASPSGFDDLSPWRFVGASQTSDILPWRELARALQSRRWLALRSKAEGIDSTLGHESYPEVPSRWFTRALAFPKPRLTTWSDRRAFRDSVEKALEGAPPSVTLTGPQAVALELTDTVERDIAKASIFAALAVLFLTWLTFRSLSDTAVALLPMLLGLIWAAAILLAMGQSFHAMNLPMIPLILGMGVDDGIHLTHRWRTMGRPRDAASLRWIVRSTGRAIVLTSVTTIAGFGSLMFAQHRGLASMGLAVSVGMATCLVASIFVWPAVVETLQRGGQDSAEPLMPAS